mmetsp:Transcript_52404/g.132469  ORF Transcript_52404/g.132469 Transcript_52404/m.132469 type:complete len:124 (+) Transcript_52404:125-496(+)
MAEAEAVPQEAGAPVDAAGAFPSQYDENGMRSIDKEEESLRGAQLKIACSMPDGSVQNISCFMGNDVTYAKAQLARALDIEFGRIKLFLDGKLMFDPLSFNDFPAIEQSTTKEISVTVQIDPE